MTSRRTVRRPGGSYAAGRPFEGLPSVPLPQPLLAAPPERRGGAWRVSPSRWCAAARYPPPTRIFSRARARARHRRRKGRRGTSATRRATAAMTCAAHPRLSSRAALFTCRSTSSSLRDVDVGAADAANACYPCIKGVYRTPSCSTRGRAARPSPTAPAAARFAQGRRVALLARRRRVHTVHVYACVGTRARVLRTVEFGVLRGPDT